MARSKRQEKAIIPFKPDYEEDAVEYIKHRRSETNAGVTEEVTECVPLLLDDATLYLILKFFSTFAHARATLQWTTGAKLFQKFRIHLSEMHLQTWQIETNGMNQNVNNFNTALAAFKSTLLQG